MQILVIFKTTGFRHDSISTGLKMLAEMAQMEHWELTLTNNTELLTSDFLKSFELIIFLATSGTIFKETQRQAIEDFVCSGKGLLTVHSGTDTDPEWIWYNQQIGARFIGHPPVQQARLLIEDFRNPATSFFPNPEWVVTDEWYSFHRNPRNDVHVLISVDESTYDVDDNCWFPEAKQRMNDHPLVWYSFALKGRVFQTALGHTPEMYVDPMFLAHIKGAILWTAGCSPNLYGS